MAVKTESRVDAFQPELSRAPSVKVVERVAHAACPGAPQLGIERLDLLQLRVQRCSLARERNERSVLRLQGGGDRWKVCTRPGSASWVHRPRAPGTDLVASAVIARRQTTVSARFAGRHVNRELDDRCPQNTYLNGCLVPS